jgi:hypothetical protein
MDDGMRMVSLLSDGQWMRRIAMAIGDGTAGQCLPKRRVDELALSQGAWFGKAAMKRQLVRRREVKAWMNGTKFQLPTRGRETRVCYGGEEEEEGWMDERMGG